MANFSNTVPVTDFINNAGASTMQIIRNPKNQKRFFVIPGTDKSGHVSSKVEKLSRDLYVSWVEGENENGDTFAMFSLHKGSDTNVEDTLTL
tara:strand:- start:532 stop:807 length:276 start_codon:yes stop_codon:yes gene_type:complete